MAQLLSSDGAIRQWFLAEAVKQRAMAEDTILTPITQLSDILEREQVIGALSQLRLHMELLDRLQTAATHQVNVKEQQQQRNS